MSAQKIGLYVGKFQPFHNGHLYAIKHIAPQVDQLIIVIGSSQYANLPDQPFSAQQRRQMIEQSLVAEGIANFSIVEVPDIHDPPKWMEHLQGYVKHFDIVFTNNESVAQLFRDRGLKVQSIPTLPGVSGTQIRHLMARQDSKWQSLVPKATNATIAAKSF